MPAEEKHEFFPSFFDVLQNENSSILAYKRCTLVLVVVVYQNLELELVLSTEIFHNTIRFQGFFFTQYYKLKI